MIRLCNAHFEDLKVKWGGEDAIKRAYEDYEIVSTKECQHLDCIRSQGLYPFAICPHCNQKIRILLAK